jgi:Domain of unknown function (DUF1911)
MDAHPSCLGYASALQICVFNATAAAIYSQKCTTALNKWHRCTDFVTREMWTTLHLTNYHEDLACLAFLVALRYTPDSLVLISQWIGHQGEDGLLDRIAIAVGDTEKRVKRNSKFELQYQPLVEVIDAPKELQAALLQTYLSSWYQRLKQAAWHNTHKGEAFNGYWCFEAALAVMLWDIDDSTFADHKHYPLDLVNNFKKIKSTT